MGTKFIHIITGEVNMYMNTLKIVCTKLPSVIILWTPDITSPSWQVSPFTRIINMTCLAQWKLSALGLTLDNVCVSMDRHKVDMIILLRPINFWSWCTLYMMKRTGQTVLQRRMISRPGVPTMSFPWETRPLPVWLLAQIGRFPLFLFPTSV